jgi:hypothetical protein
MKTTLKFALAGVLSLGLGACGGSDSEPDAGTTPTTSDAGAADAASAVDTAAAVDTAPAAPQYTWVAIQDHNDPATACATNGPGTDVDAVELSRGGVVIGYGLKGTATFTANATPYCAPKSCGAGRDAVCKYAVGSSVYTQAQLQAFAEGPKDGKVFADVTDTGYISLNGGTLQMQIGDQTGAGTAQVLQTGDVIKVYEVDQTYVSSGDAFAGCLCAPESFVVSLQSADGQSVVALKPTKIETANDTCTALSAASTDGCGTTAFVVP